MSEPELGAGQSSGQDGARDRTELGTGQSSGQDGARGRMELGQDGAPVHMLLGTELDLQLTMSSPGAASGPGVLVSGSPLQSSARYSAKHTDINCH